jgi:hypothetical protein
LAVPDPGVAQPGATAPTIRSKTGKTKPKIYTDETVRYGLLCTTSEPENLQIALSNKNWKEVLVPS